MKRQNWEEHLARAERETVSLLKKKRPEEAELPIIVNFVATTPVLPQDSELVCTLPLMNICTKWGCCQYAPNLFVALISKIRDSTAVSTVLLFVSGVMVVVSGQSINHARDVSQYCRLNLENTKCMMKRKNAETGEMQVYEGTLKARTTFKECFIHNIVGHGNVGMRIDLQALVNAAPECWKWFPDLFPGAKGKIWLTHSNQCECEASDVNRLHAHHSTEEQKLLGKRSKCKCAVKVLIFDTGQVVITGGRSIQDINSVLARIRNLAPHFESAQQEDVPKDERFYQRLSCMMVSGTQDNARRAKTVQQPQIKTMDVVAAVVAGISLDVAAAAPTPVSLDEDTSVTPLMRVAEAGRVDEVRMLLMMEPECRHQTDARGQTALQRLKALQNDDENIQAIIKLLSL